MKFIIHLLLGGLTVVIASYLLPGVAVSSFLMAVLVAIVLALANIIIRPVLLFLTLPINILTLGLFTFVVNAIIILIVAYIVPGFVVDSFWWALAFSFVISIVGAILHSTFPFDSRSRRKR